VSRADERHRERIHRERRHGLTNGLLVDLESTERDVPETGRECRIMLSDDVTERNDFAGELVAARAAALSASSLKSEFLANISHEILTPMNAVVGLTQVLLETALDDEQRALAAQVAESGEQMLRLIGDLLDVSRIEACQLHIAMADFDLRATIELACRISEIEALNKHVGFEMSLASSVPQRTRGDSRRLRQVITSLVSNAVKFTIDGAVTVRASCSSSYGERDVVHVEVIDSGIGIEQAMVDRMFEPFTQADASTTRAYGGPGLGLAIARELTELMGGTIGAESRIGEGSTFWIDLPVIPALSSGGYIPVGAR